MVQQRREDIGKYTGSLKADDINIYMRHNPTQATRTRVGTISDATIERKWGIKHVKKKLYEQRLNPVTKGGKIKGDAVLPSLDRLHKNMESVCSKRSKSYMSGDTMSRVYS